MNRIIVDTNDLEDDYSNNSRRDFLKKSLLLGGGLALGSDELFARRSHKRALHLHSPHTGQSIYTTYFDGYRYNITSLFKIDRLMMDFRAWQIARMDLKLLNLLYNIQSYVGHHHKIDIISGYRSPSTNRYLRRHSRGVAKHSYHMKAMAADIHISGVRLHKLRDIAKGMGLGGVGYYPRSNFVHIDVGPVRYWRRG